ncbi:MAG: type II secretion system protein GspG [Spirochaetia bacterium]|nr:type II secretion system protein GspG [Spirochaetia bacterium]
MHQKYIKKYRLIGKNRKKRGLTLIEIALVLAAIAIIMGILYSTISTDPLDKAKILRVKSSSQTIPILLENYEFENPSLDEGASLEILSKRNPENPGYKPVKKDAVSDPWGNFYHICRDEYGTKQICSYGKDNEMGGEDENEDFILTDESSWPLWLSGTKKEDG